MAAQKTRDRIVDALMRLAAERPWDEITPETVAAAAGVGLATLRGAYDGRFAMLDDFARRLDTRVLVERDAELAGEAPRERLFDALFARLEALVPHRPALRNLAAAARRDPLTALELNRIAVRSMAWMLAAAGIPATGTRGLLRAQGLALVWARVLRVFLDDDDAGLARTMAELDRRLREAERMVVRAERLRRLFGRGRRRPPADAGGADADVAEGHPS